MTAFLFIPATADAGLTRRVDFVNIARLFAEPDEPPVSHRRAATMTRLLAGLLITLCALGDTLLVARPEALAHCFAGPHQTDGTPIKTADS